MKNVVCIIARTNSMRLPKKTILKIGGKKTIEHIIDSMKEMKYADKIYLCTSVDEADQILLDIAEKNGIEGYAGSREAVISRILDVAEKENADNVLRVTGDNLFTDSIFLDRALKEHINNDADYTRVENLPIGVTGEVMKVAAVKDCYDKMDPSKSEYLAVYMFQPEEYKCLTLIPPDKFNLPYNTLTVDTPQDWERTKFIFKHIHKSKIYLGDIEELNNKITIPYYKISEDDLVKLPNDVTITYKEYRKLSEKKIEKCMQIKIEESYYNEERNRRHLNQQWF